MGCALMAVNIKKYSAINNKNNPFSHDYIRKSSYVYLFRINTTAFSYLRLVLSQPLCYIIYICRIVLQLHPNAVDFIYSLIISACCSFCFHSFYHQSISTDGMLSRIKLQLLALKQKRYYHAKYND